MPVSKISERPFATLPLAGDEIVAVVQGGVTKQVAINQIIVLKSYTVATLPTATPAAQLIYVSNEVGGAVPAFSDGTNWRRVTDRAIVSA